jgi:hypothetical protein
MGACLPLYLGCIWHICKHHWTKACYGIRLVCSLCCCMALVRDFTQPAQLLWAQVQVCTECLFTACSAACSLAVRCHLSLHTES